MSALTRSEMTDPQKTPQIAVFHQAAKLLPDNRSLLAVVILPVIAAIALTAIGVHLVTALIVSFLIATAIWKSAGFSLRKLFRRRTADIRIEFDILPKYQKWSIFFAALALMVWRFPAHAQILHLPLGVAAFFFGLIVAWRILQSRVGIIVGEESIEATGVLYKNSLLGRMKRSWNDLHSVGLEMTVSMAPSIFWPAQDRSALSFYFRSGGNLKIRLTKLSQSESHTLMMCLARFADPLTLNSDVAALQKTILTVGSHTPNLSFTEFWQDNLKQSFAETNFVILGRGHQLKQGELEILLPLSSGGPRAVYLCNDVGGAQFVLKELSLNVLSDPSAKSKHLELFKREAEILARLDHPRIVKVLDSFVEQDRQYTLLEFVPGLTLRQFVQLNGPIEERLVWTFSRQLIEALRYLHECNEPIIHRDIAPDNVVVNESENVTLIDFGAANEVALQSNSTIIGKQCYIAPEQLRGAACTQSDLFSLGATMFFMLTGSEPEPISTSHPRTINTNVSVAMDSLVSRLTDMEIENRPSSASALQNLLVSSESQAIGGQHL
jgi:Protein kinase domain